MGVLDGLTIELFLCICVECCIFAVTAILPDRKYTKSMTHLSSAEMAILNFWYGYIRTNSVTSVRPMLVYYLMTEMLIENNQQLPDKRRPARPSEDAVMRIGATSGALSKWRRKWQKTWWNVHQK